MALTTAARDTASYNRDWTSLDEVWDDGMEDVIQNTHELFWTLWNAGRVKFVRGGEYFNQVNEAVRNTTFEAFRGTQAFTVAQNEGPPAVSWRMANYKMSLMQTWNESIATSGDPARLDLLQHDIDVLGKSFADNLNSVVQQGQGNGSLHIEGIEDTIYSATTTAGTQPNTFTTRAQAQAGTYNSYAKLDRTGTDNHAKGWRNLAMDLDENGASDSFVLTNTVFTAFRRMQHLLTTGRTTKPDLCLMSLQPYDQFLAMQYATGTASVIRIEKADMDLGSETISFNGMTIVKVGGIEYSTVGVSGDVTDGTGICYMLNTDTWELLFEEQAFFAWTDWIHVPLASYVVAHNLLRFLLRCTNPGLNGVIFNFGVTA